MNPRRWRTTCFNNTNRLFFGYAIVWALGILLGIAIPFFTGEEYMVATITARLRPNLYVLYLSNAFPLVVLWILLIYRRYGFACAILFLYGILQGYCGMCVSIAFGFGGWLVRRLLLFSGSFISVAIWWLILSSFNHRCHSKQLFYSVLFVSSVTFFDYFVISPFLMGII